ncbi:MAG: hypothetical protein ACRD43_00030, partial [Pyrinomonadaceae bacterium]
REQTPEEKRLAAEVEEKRKAGGFEAKKEISSMLKSIEKRLVGQISDLSKEIETKTRSMAAKAQAKPVTSPEIEELKAQRDALQASHQEIFGRPGMSDEARLKAWKTRTANRIDELEQKIKDQDFSPRPKPAPFKMDPDAEKLRVQIERVKKHFQEDLFRDRFKNRPISEKIQDTFTKWRRGFLLSSPVTLAKLTAAAVERMVITPTEEVIGAGWSTVLPQIAKAAPREGGFNVKAEAKSLAQAMTAGMKDAYNQLRLAHTDLEVLYGKTDPISPSAIDFFGHLHGALKSPVKRAEFERSLEKRMAHAIRNKIDVSDPAVQMRIALEAYGDANRSIFMQDNRVIN